MRAWKPKTVTVLEDQREWWVARKGRKTVSNPMADAAARARGQVVLKRYPSTRSKVSCDACGEESYHFEANYDPKLDLFAVPYAGSNGGIGYEIEATSWEDVLGKRERRVFLSECCQAPRMVREKRR